MTYAQARWAGVSERLLPWLRRLGLGLLLTLLAVSGGGGDPATLWFALRSAAAWTVLPLAWAGSVLGTLLQALLALAVLRALRPWLQPTGWLETERCWPLDPRDLRRSDARLALAALSPLLLLQLTGVLALAQPRLGLGWLLGSLLGATAGVLLMGRHRGLARPALRSELAPAAPRRPQTLSATQALLLLPLWRGPLRRSAQWLAALSLLLSAWPWALAAGLPGALVAMGWVALCWLGQQRVQAQLDDEGAALLAALPPLPLNLRHWQWRLRALALLPLVLALPSAVLAIGFSAHSLRPWVALSLLGLLLGLSAWSALQRLRADDAHAVRLLLGLALLLALASDVLVGRV